MREGHLGVVRLLLSAGVDVDGAVDEVVRGEQTYRTGRPVRVGTTPLLLAVTNAHWDVAAALLEAGADPNADGPGYTALHVIPRVRKPGVGDNDPAPDGSGRMTSLELVRTLVEHGADVDARMPIRRNLNNTRHHEPGSTPFMLASLVADAELMRTLVDLGADPLATNAENSTPLMAAAGLGTRSPGEDAGTEAEVLEAVQLALDLGNDVDAVDARGETAMHGAAYKNLPAVVGLLAASGADVGVWARKNQFGWSPLTIARGYRFGNFKPSPVTVAAIEQAMLAAGITPPTEEEEAAEGYDIYAPRPPARRPRGGGAGPAALSRPRPVAWATGGASMRNRHLVRTVAPAVLIALALGAGPARAQGAGEDWAPPRLPDGRPDLQGVWLSNTATPLQRPEAFGDRAYLTDEEVATLSARVERIFRNGRSAFAIPESAFFAALNDVETYEAWSTSSSIGMVDVWITDRTSLVVDPPDGRIPALTPEARAREAAVDTGWELKTGPEDLNNIHRCVTTGVPRLGGNFGAGPYTFYQMVQTPDTVAFVSEAFHDARIIPLDGRPISVTPSASGTATRAAAGTATRWSSRPATSRRTATTGGPPRASISSSGSP